MQPIPQSAAPATRLGYHPELDGLRGISILLVFVHHIYHRPLPGGFLGVDIFFVLSGFLITSLLVQEWERRGAISLKKFYIRRALRLMPALLLLVLLLGCFALLFLDSERARATYQGIWLTLSYVSNWFYAFADITANNPLGITWSLAIEEQFYFLWPLALSVFLRSRLERRWLLAGLAVTIVLIAFYRRWLFQQGAPVERLYYASDTRADALLIGCLLGLLISWNLVPRNRILELCAKALAIVAVAFLGYLAATGNWNEPLFYESGGFTLIAISAAIVLAVVLLWPPKLALWVLKFPPLVWVGRISYGLYLWHWPVRWYLYGEAGFPASNGQLAIAIVLSLALTTTSYYLVERRFLRLKGRFS